MKIPAGKYILRDEKAKKLQADVMAGKLGNNPEKEMFNPKAPYTVGLDFSGVRNAVIDGQGAELIVDGFMETLSISNCENVTIRGLSIDHLRKPYSCLLYTSRCV